MSWLRLVGKLSISVEKGSGVVIELVDVFVRGKSEIFILVKSSDCGDFFW